MPRQRANKRAQQRAANKPANAAASTSSATSTSAAAATKPVDAATASLHRFQLPSNDTAITIACFQATSLTLAAAQMLQHGSISAVQQRYPDWSKLPELLLSRVLAYCERQYIIAAGRCCLNWADTLNNASVWSFLATFNPQSTVSPTLLAEVIKRCCPVSVHLTWPMFNDTKLINRLLLTKLQRLRCDVSMLDKLMRMQKRGLYPAIFHLKHLTVDRGDVSGAKGPEGREFRENTLCERLVEIGMAFPALLTIEQAGWSAPAYCLLIRKGVQLQRLQRGEKVSPTENLVVRTDKRNGEPKVQDQPHFEVVWEITRSNQTPNFQFKVIAVNVQWHLRWSGKPHGSYNSWQSFEYVVRGIHEEAPFPADLATYAIEMDNQHLAAFLDVVMWTPTDHLLLRLDVGKVWVCDSEEAPAEVRKTRVGVVTLCNQQRPAHDVVLADRLIGWLAACDELQLLNLNNVTVSSNALHLFVSSRQALQLPFCAVTLHQCLINTIELASSNASIAN